VRLKGESYGSSQGCSRVLLEPWRKAIDAPGLETGPANPRRSHIEGVGSFTYCRCGLTRRCFAGSGTGLCGHKTGKDRYSAGVARHGAQPSPALGNPPSALEYYYPTVRHAGFDVPRLEEGRRERFGACPTHSIDGTVKR
jgi:hypothetical protein